MALAAAVIGLGIGAAILANELSKTDAPDVKQRVNIPPPPPRPLIPPPTANTAAEEATQDAQRAAAEERARQRSLRRRSRNPIAQPILGARSVLGN